MDEWAQRGNLSVVRYVQETENIFGEISQLSAEEIVKQPLRGKFFRFLARENKIDTPVAFEIRTGVDARHFWDFYYANKESAEIRTIMKIAKGMCMDLLQARILFMLYGYMIDMMPWEYSVLATVCTIKLTDDSCLNERYDALVEAYKKANKKLD